MGKKRSKPRIDAGEKIELHCEQPMRKGQGRSGRDDYYVLVCRVPGCNGWKSSLIPVSEQDKS